MAAQARLIILDEPVSALDVSIRAQIMTLLEDLQQRLGMSYLFIGHDLATVTHISHQIAVMYLGKIVEIGESQELSLNPQHPYTKALFAAALPAHPDDARDDLVVTGEVPSALNPPSGCRFHPRCPFVMPQCSRAGAGAVAGGRSATGGLPALRARALPSNGRAVGTAVGTGS